MNTVSFEEHKMSKDKYLSIFCEVLFLTIIMLTLSIFSCQIKAIVFKISS